MLLLSCPHPVSVSFSFVISRGPPLPTRDKTSLMAVMRSYRGSYRGSDKNFPLPTIIVQAPQARYRPPQNPPGHLQMMQAINVNNDQVCSKTQQ